MSQRTLGDVKAHERLDAIEKRLDKLEQLLDAAIWAKLHDLPFENLVLARQPLPATPTEG